MFEPSPNLYNTLKAIPDIKIVLSEQPQSLAMYINNSRAPLNDVRVRRAIAYAVDKQGLVDRFTGGSPKVAWADQPQYSYYYNPDVEKYPSNIVTAKKRWLRRAYTPGPDGMMRKNGRPLSLQLTYNVENATRRLVTVQVQSALKHAGIDAPIKAYPVNVLGTTYGQGGILTNGKYDIAIGGCVAAYNGGLPGWQTSAHTIPRHPYRESGSAVELTQASQPE
jgi:ABC-type transport system substrate-binding protein